MKVLLRAYTALNVGDDLFIHIITKRYPQAEFVLASDVGAEYDRFISMHDNLRPSAEHSLTYRIARRLGNAPYIDKSILGGFDAAVYIGGSIFMENTENRYLEHVLDEETKYCRDHGIPYYILSCNFGPYSTDGYRQRMADCFARCEDVCFRDNASYSMFEHIPSARLTPDASFSYKHESVPRRSSVLGIVPIDYTHRPQGKEFAEKYTLRLAKAAAEHIRAGGQAELFCFCSAGGDGQAAQAIAEHIGSSVLIRTYDGDIESFLGTYLSCGSVIASRFHAVLLALQHNIPVCIDIYSDKTKNVLIDMGVDPKNASSGITSGLASDFCRNNAQRVWAKFDEFYKTFLRKTIDKITPDII